eukprot:gene24803-biopygen5959
MLCSAPSLFCSRLFCSGLGREQVRLTGGGAGVVSGGVHWDYYPPLGDVRTGLQADFHCNGPSLSATALASLDNHNFPQGITCDVHISVPPAHFLRIFEAFGAA